MQCQYFKNVHSFVSTGFQYRLHDIEDLKGFGKTHKACPYYTARKWAEVGWLAAVAAGAADLWRCRW